MILQPNTSQRRKLRSFDPSNLLLPHGKPPAPQSRWRLPFLSQTIGLRVGWTPSFHSNTGSNIREWNDVSHAYLWTVRTTRVPRDSNTARLLSCILQEATAARQPFKFQVDRILRRILFQASERSILPAPSCCSHRKPCGRLSCWLRLLQASLQLLPPPQTCWRPRVFSTLQLTRSALQFKGNKGSATLQMLP